MSNPLELTEDDLRGLPPEVLRELSIFKKNEQRSPYIETPIQSMTMTPRKFREIWRLTEVMCPE
jgi:hypothetical protein